MKVYLDTVGCRLNQSEIESYARQFRAAGHVLVGAPAEADLIVVNTCAVTTQAASDSRQKLRQAARAGTHSKGIIATGCWVTLSPQQAAALPGVQQVVLNADKDRLVTNLLGKPPETLSLNSAPRPAEPVEAEPGEVEPVEAVNDSAEPIERQPIPGARARTRAFLKVQDGCDNHCTFCVTVLARGGSRSRPLPEILAETLHYTATAREIVLTGIHLGSWGQDWETPQHLRTLVQSLLDATEAVNGSAAGRRPPRLRLSSLEPWDLDDSFFALWQNPRLCRHLHLPLQSGCAATLRRMGRKTTPDSFARLVAAARAAIPDVAITTDLIVGFPGETEAEFAESLAFVRQMQFAEGHVFPYSARPGTAAARMKGQIAHPVRKERSAQMRALLTEAAHTYRAGFIGRQTSALWESIAATGPQGWELHGLTDNYLRVAVHAPQALWNQITPVRLTGLSEDGLFGELMNEETSL